MSYVSSLFSSNASSIRQYVLNIQQSEKILLEVAAKFGGEYSLSNENTINFSTFDTVLPRSSLPFLSKESGCVLGGCGIIRKDQEAENLIMHGVCAEASTPSQNTNVSTKQKTPLVLLHGYANGATVYYRNLRGLAEQQNLFSRVYAVDMLGWGLSSRPKFAGVIKDIETAENFFVDSLEEWRKRNNIDKMILGGHSLGGYISVAYCEKYPKRIERLILISPAGVPHRTSEEEEEEKKRLNEAPITFRILRGIMLGFWNNGITPGQFVRSLSEYRGKNLVGMYVRNRIPIITNEKEQKALTDFFYNSFCLPGSGEYSLNIFLKPPAYAYKPTVDRIPRLKVSHVSFLYGDRDWMDYRGGFQVQKRCNEINSFDKESNGAPQVEVMIVPDAGHMLMLDNYEAFNKSIIKSILFDK